MKVVMDTSIEFDLDENGMPSESARLDLGEMEKKMDELKSCRVRLTIKVEVILP